MIRKIIYMLLFAVLSVILSGCGHVNFAPGKAYMDMEPSVTVSH